MPTEDAAHFVDRVEMRVNRRVTRRRFEFRLYVVATRALEVDDPVRFFRLILPIRLTRQDPDDIVKRDARRDRKGVKDAEDRTVGIEGIDAGRRFEERRIVLEVLLLADDRRADHA